MPQPSVLLASLMCARLTRFIARRTVVWTNKDILNHTVTSDTGLFDSGSLSKDMSWNHTFTEAGRYAYHCDMHTFMTGTVNVR